jgi:DNA-binding winged helix-turn-helix (wHTH) protein
MIFAFDDLELNADTLELRRGGAPVRADALVLRLLSVLLEHPGELVTKERLHARVWGGRAVSENVITVAMARLRKTLGRTGDAPPYVVTVHGRGYRFARPVDVRAASHAVAPSRPVPASRPFVGRETALARLREILSEARAGRGSVAVILGEAGIGKTRLVEALESEAAPDGFAVAWGICREAGDTPPLWPFVQLVRELIERARPGAQEPRLSRAIDELARLLPELRGSSVATPLPENQAPVGTHRMFDAIARVLSLIAEVRPCFLVVDDLHRADSGSLEVVRYFIDQIARTRVALVATYRTGVALSPASSRHVGYVLGHRNAVRVCLEPLAESQVAAYVASQLDDPDGALGRAVFEKSEGNPFLMTELLRLVSGGSGGTSLRLPDVALEQMRQRVSAVNDGARGVLSVAAVIGRHFDFATLEAVSLLSAAELADALADAAEHGVVRPTSGTRTSFAFAHDLLRAVLYEQLPAGERRALHLRVGAALEQRRAAGVDVTDAELAYHTYSALPAGNPREAVRRCVDAAAAASRRRAYSDGVRALGQALEALDLVPHPSPRFRLSLLVSRSTQARVCHSSEFDAIAEDAMRLARELGDVTRLGQVGLLLDVHPGLPALPGARAVLEEAFSRLPSGEDEMRACLLARLSNSGPRAFDRRRTVPALSEAAALAHRCGTVLGRYIVSTARLYAEGGPGRDVESAALVADLESLCAEHPDALSVIPVLIDLHRAIHAAQHGGGDQAAAALERSEARCRTLGHVELLWHTERFRLLSRRDELDPGRFTASLRALHRRAEKDAIRSASLFVAFDVAVVIARDGALGAGERDVLSQLSPRIDDEPPALWVLRVRTLAAAGRTAEARTLLHVLPADELSHLPADRDHVGTLGTLLRVASALGELEYVRMLQALLVPYEAFVAVNAAFFSEGRVAEVIEATGGGAMCARVAYATPSTFGIARPTRP